MAILSFKKGVRQKKKIQKSLYFILKKDFLKIYAVLNEFLVNYRSRTCASERTGSLWCFASFLSFSAKQRISDAYLHVRENHGAWCPNVHYSLIVAVEEELLSRPLITPEKRCKRDGVKLFPLDRSILEFWRPEVSKPVACISGRDVSMQVVSMRIPKNPCRSWVLQVYWAPGVCPPERQCE